mmetsp:Transcript_116704/g.362604  ORF Transcript_116704/g.362604 Transcript_116704/m.362604 type:complete len:694 (-) Transcript_116704:5-2086(-)
MVLLGLAAGGVVGGASSTFSYNREAWMTDVQVDQNRRYQCQQVRLSEAEMFREDIRDLAGAAVQKQNNCVIIATLILGMIAECWIEGSVPEGSAQFVVTAYMLCVGSSLLYMVLCVLCALLATNMATNCQKELLTTFVRLPAEELVAEIQAAAQAESSEAFEHQGVATMFRVPGFSRLARQTGGAADAGSLAGAEDLEAGSSTDSASEPGQVTSAARHLAVFQLKEREWDVLEKYSMLFGALGMSHLLQAFGYYSAAKYYAGDHWASWIVQFLAVAVDAIFARVYMKGSSCMAVVGLLLNVGGPIACAVAILHNEPKWVDAVCIPLCFSCHLIWNCIGLIRFLSMRRDASEVQTQDETHARRHGRLGSFEEAALQKGHGRGSATVGGSRKRGSSGSALRSRQHWLPLLGNTVVIIAWFMSLGWATYHAAKGTGDDGSPPTNLPRRLASRSAPIAEDAAPTAAIAWEELAVAWPSPRFQPHAVACGRDGRCFMAGDFLAFELSTAAQGGLALLPVPCNVAGAISDLAVNCHGSGGCRLLALTQGPSTPPEVVDCATGDTQPLLRDLGPAQRLASRGAELLTTHGRRVVQRAAQQGSWAPLWAVADARAEGLAALDTTAGSGDLVLFYRSGAVEVLGQAAGAPCGSGQLPPPAAGAVMAGATEAGGSALVLLRARGAGGTARLGRMALPRGGACA